MSRTSPLSVIRVNSPCPESWDAMTGDETRRFCAGCQRHVHNLSAMSREEAERLVCESAGRLCVRYEQGPDGLPVTLNYQKPGRVRGGWKLWTMVGTIGACITGAVHALVQEKPVPPVQTPAALGRIVMGDFAPNPPPPLHPTTPPICREEPPLPPAPHPPVDVPVASTAMSLEPQ